jgi:hypothetical protein
VGLLDAQRVLRWSDRLMVKLVKRGIGCRDRESLGGQYVVRRLLG